MQTNKTITKESGLYSAGQTLLQAAHNYWQIYHKEVGRGAVVYLEDDNGHLVIFTRGEYKEVLMNGVREITSDPEALFI